MQSNQTEAEQTVTSAVRSMTGIWTGTAVNWKQGDHRRDPFGKSSFSGVYFPCSKGIFLSGRQTEESGKSFGFPRQGGCILKHSDRKRN